MLLPYFLTVNFEKLQSVLQLAENKQSDDEVLEDLRSNRLTSFFKKWKEKKYKKL